MIKNQNDCWTNINVIRTSTNDRSHLWEICIRCVSQVFSLSHPLTLRRQGWWPISQQATKISWPHIWRDIMWSIIKCSLWFIFLMYYRTSWPGVYHWPCGRSTLTLTQVKEVTRGLRTHLSSSLSSLSVSGYPSPSDLSLQPNDIGSYSCKTLPSKGRKAARAPRYHGKAIKSLLQWVQRCTSKWVCKRSNRLQSHFAQGNIQNAIILWPLWVKGKKIGAGCVGMRVIFQWCHFKCAGLGWRWMTLGRAGEVVSRSSLRLSA